MKNTSFFLIIIFFFVSSKAQDFEQQLKKADQNWLNKNLEAAISGYRSLIQSGSLPEEYKPLIYLRLAEAQFQANKLTSCKHTLSEMSSLGPMREHYRIKKSELERKLTQFFPSYYTPLPENMKTVARIYVSQKFSGRSDGTLKAPFKAIEEALIVASRVLNDPGTKDGAIEILLMDNEYNSTSTVRLDAHFSGNQKNPLIIRSVSPAYSTTINGGIEITSWKVETDTERLALLPANSRGKVLVADMKENGVEGIDELVFGGWGSRRGFNTKPVPQLFYKGNLIHFSRWPDDEFKVFPLTSFKDKRADNWAKEKDVWIHGYFGNLWSDVYEKLDDYQDSVILAPPFNSNVKESGKWYALNLLSEMNKEGECKISPEEGKIWFFPPDDFNPEECIFSVYGKPFDLENCNFITFRDIDFCYLRGDAISANKCSNLSFVNCSFRDISGYALQIQGGNGHLIHSCSFEDMGRGGIQLNSGKMENLEFSGSLVENCVFRNLSRIDRTYTPGIWLYGCGIQVQHCLFENIPSSGMRIEGVNMLVQLNEFSSCVTESDDQGALESHGNALFRGNTIRWNYFHDIGSEPQQMAAGVRLDDAICGFNIVENIFVRSQKGVFGAVQIHGGKDNIVEGNYFFDCNAAISQSAWEDIRWRTMLKKEHLRNNYWESKLWQETFPELKNIFENADKNYYTDNILVNGKTLFFRKADITPILKNTLMRDSHYVLSIDDVKKYMTPWHLIPLEEIGINKNNKADNY